MVCDLSEPGPVPDVPHVKYTNVKVEDKTSNLIIYSYIYHTQDMEALFVR